MILRFVKNLIFYYLDSFYNKLLNKINYDSIISLFLFLKTAKLLQELRRFLIDKIGLGVEKNVNGTDFDKNCLLIYIIHPFRQVINGCSHHNAWRAKKLARIIGEFEYNVDVVDQHDPKPKLRMKYDLVIDNRPDINKSYFKYFSKSCKKIAYLTEASPAFHNNGELRRILSLYKRKKVLLKQQRFTKPYNKALLESFDAAFLFGNSFTLKTYQQDYNLKKVFFIKNHGYTFIKNNISSKKNSKNFLFFNSSGQVLKGLDLLLEVFSKYTPHLNLYICSLFKNEPEFCLAYKKELFHTKNIIPIGFIDINSRKFHELIQICAFTVLPSASEGQSGSVLTAMSAGLIPIISKQCGFEENEAYYFKDDQICTLKKTLLFFSSKSTKWIEEESSRMIRLIKEKYSKKNFKESIRSAFKGVLQ